MRVDDLARLGGGKLPGEEIVNLHYIIYVVHV
jgi:hypothetical protein